MTTSKIYTQTAGELIEGALRDARIIPAEQPINAVDYENGIKSLNKVSKYWQTKGAHLWLIRRAILPMNVGQMVYELGPDGDPCGYADTFVATTLGANALLAATALTVDDSAGMEAAPDILDADPTDSTQDWTASLSTLSISSGLRVTNSGAAAGSATYELDATVGQTYRVRFSYTKGTSAGATFSVLNATTVEDTVTLNASAANQELTITAVLDTITFKIANTSTTIAQYSTIYDLQYVDEVSGSYIGIGLDDSSMCWTHVLNVNSATSIDITAGLTDTATDGAQVFSYVEQIDRPLLLEDNMMFNANTTSSGIPVNKWSRQEYMQQPQKNGPGTVVQWYYNPTLALGKLYVWQTANNIQNTLDFDVRVPISVYSNTSDELDYPSEAFLPLQWAVASDLGPSYGVKQTQQAINEDKAKEFFESWQGSDQDDGSFYVQPDFSGR